MSETPKLSNNPLAMGAGIDHRTSRSQPLTRQGVQFSLIRKPPKAMGEGVRKAEATRGGRHIDPTSASPKYLQLREVLLDLIASELSFHARSPPNETSMNASASSRWTRLNGLRKGIVCPQRSGAHIRPRSAGRPTGGPSLVRVAIFIGHLVSVCRGDRDGLRSQSARYHPCTVHLRPLGASP
jgi:hypothetical protein